MNLKQPVLGFVGVGKMGSPMATRLLEAGYTLCVFDPSAAAVEKMSARGATRAASPAEVASIAGIVFMCLPTPDVVRSVALGEQGVVHGSAIRTLVDLGTTGPVTERDLGRGLSEHGVTLVDSPVTGGIAGAIAGTLAVMVACPKETLAEVEPILKNLGRVIYTGEAPGLAQTAKLANNLLSAAALAISAEAMAMGVKAGLDPQILLDIINAGSGRNSATEDKFPRAILPGTFDFGMATELFCKDVRLCVDEAESLGVPMIVGSAVRQMFDVTKARFGPSSDFTCIAKVIEEWAGVEIRRSKNH
jgi:3-hydroxyisobutyrate dehydrogenase-like beta-hydroxyacid dehydrogenase